MKFTTTSFLAGLVLAASASPTMAGQLRKLEEVNGFEANEDAAGQEPIVTNSLSARGRTNKAPMRETTIFHDLVAGQCVADHKCATMWGDPHIVTFDNVKYDCMGRGEYVLMRSTTTNFEVQGRFVPGYYHSDLASTPNHNEWGTEKTKSGKGVSVAAGISVDTGVEGAPHFDAFATNPRPGVCGVNYFVNDQPANFGDDGLAYPGMQYFKQVKVGKDKVDYVFWKDSGIMVTVFVRKGTYGCVLAAKICLPPSMLATEKVVGLMGTPNGDKSDEWMDQYGTTLQRGTGLWKKAYDYCTQNWCVRDASESIFGYPEGESWATHAEGGCVDNIEYDPETELAVMDATTECKECCAPAAEGIDKIQCLTECEEAADIDTGIQQCLINLETETSLEGVERKCPDPIVTTTPAPETTTVRPGTNGDPHFRTHGGEMFDFHGGCDLVLVDNPDFQDGLGMLIHVRTKIETWWSYVESAAVRIGDQILEIQGGDKAEWLFTNGIANEDVVDGKWYNVKFAGHVMRFKKSGRNREAHLYLMNGEKLMMKTYNDFVKVELGKDRSMYKGSHGILGRYPDGKRVGRDGETLIEDINTYGQEWQVTPDEPKLFHTYEGDFIVPAGQKCAMPTETLEKKELRARRLADGLSMDQAEQACIHITDPMDHKACVFDVIATQDTDMAAVW